jgi:hypothetical protein
MKENQRARGLAALGRAGTLRGIEVLDHIPVQAPISAALLFRASAADRHVGPGPVHEITAMAFADTNSTGNLCLRLIDRSMLTPASVRRIPGAYGQRHQSGLASGVF